MTQHLSADDVRTVFEEYAIELDDLSVAGELADAATCKTEAEAVALMHKHAQVLRGEWEGDMREAAAFASERD